MIGPTSAIILAGGHSRRLGHDKRRLRLWGEHGLQLLEHTITVVAALCADVIVVLNDAEQWPNLAARCVPDVYPAAGALGGIYSGLLAAHHDYALVVACDMPFLSVALLQALLAQPRDYDLLVPEALEAQSTRNRLNLEPLHAIYSRACCDPIQRALAAQQYGVTAFFDQVQVVRFPATEVRRLDPTGRALTSINTPEQLRALVGGSC
jgi:molybdopterin-guanine dinucleotide biosynthesis protein A